MTYYNYDRYEEIVGKTRELVAKKLGASEEDRLTFVEFSWDGGFCETCSYTEYGFAVLLNGNEVYNSRTANTFVTSPFSGFVDWLDS